jgi:hypothetical protein
MRNAYKKPLFWRIFPYVFGVIFTIALAVIVGQFALIGWAGYHMITNPEGSAATIGKIVAEAVAPVADAVKK